MSKKIENKKYRLDKSNIEVKYLDSQVKAYTPAYATPKSAGLDIHAFLSETITLEAGQTILIPTGLAIHLKDPNCMGMLVPRSGLGHKHGIVLGNGTGIIDADYQGELKVSLHNRSQSIFMIEPWMRIAQLIVLPILRVDWQEVDGFDTSVRGESGFGSSGH